MNAPATKGMFSYEMDSINRINGVSQDIVSPVRTVMSFFPRVIAGIKNIGKSPLSLIALILLPLIWIVLLNLRLTGNDDNIVVKIVNTGDPIKDEDRDKIFERFYRADRSRTRSDNRYGLGLAIAKRIAINHKGNIKAYSVGGDTTFEIVLKK